MSYLAPSLPFPPPRSMSQHGSRIIDIGGFSYRIPGPISSHHIDEWNCDYCKSAHPMHTYQCDKCGASRKCNTSTNTSSYVPTLSGGSIFGGIYEAGS